MENIPLKIQALAINEDTCRINGTIYKCNTILQS